MNLGECVILLVSLGMLIATAVVAIKVQIWYNKIN